MTKRYTTVIFSEKIAKKVGLDEAILLHYICFYVELNKRNESDRHYKKDKYWTYGSDTHFSEEVFPFLKPHQIRRIRKNLLVNGYIEVGSFNPFGPDKTTWYTYTDKVFEVAGLKYIAKILKKQKNSSMYRTE